MRLNPEQLRTMALNATALITAAAATEYQHYVRVREELRQPAPSTRESGSTGEPEAGAMGLATALGEAAEPTGTGAAAVVAVLTPVLAGTTAAIFLLVGYLLKLLKPEPAFARTMLTIGWVAGAVTAASVIVAAVGLLLTALRNQPSLEPGQYGDREVALAKEAWREALLERGILPFLRDALGGTGAALHGTTPPASRMPHLGYDWPGFSSPDDGPRPSFSSPDYTSPDFGGPEHQPE